MTAHSTRGRKIRISYQALVASVMVGLVALAVLAVSHTSERQLRATLVDEAERQLVLEARNLALLSTDALLSDYPELTLVPLVIEMGRNRPELDGIVVLDHQGAVQGHAEPRLIGQPWLAAADTADAVTRDFLAPGERLQAGPTRIRASAPVRHHTEGAIGQVSVALDRSHIDANVRSAREPLLKIAGVMLALSLAIVAVLLGVLFRPLQIIEQGLRRIGQGDLDTPLPIGRSLELGRLARTLNDMAADLKASRALAEAREQEVIETQREVIMTLGDVVESRSRETANHTRRVGAMTRELALLIGLPEDEADRLRLAAPMHDVGKIGVPDSILNKPGKLTVDEYTIMKTHAMIGYDILKGSQRPIMKSAALIARDHHEKWDGSGYPEGKAGEDIHIYGRLTAVVDVFDAVSCDRVYRKAMPLEKALGIIKEGRGSHFEPRLVDVFLANLNRFISISERYADRPPAAEPTADRPQKQTTPA